MFRAAMLAVLAIALSSAPAFAQERDPNGEIDVYALLLGADQTTIELPNIEIDVYALLMSAGHSTIEMPNVEVDVYALLMSADQPALEITNIELDAYALLLGDSLSMEIADISVEKLHDPIAKSSIWYHVAVRAEQINQRVNVPLKHLYVAQGTLQALDFVTTISALGRGQNEMNPLFKNGNRSAMIAAKAVATGFNVWASEHLVKRNPKAAMWLMIATNSFMSAVVVNNAVK